MPTLLKAAGYTRMPWKNGGGETVEIAVYPGGSDLAGFAWRISMATVASDGPFSVFPGIERTLSLLEGNGLTLNVADAGPILLTGESEPLAFSGEAATSATLIDGPITDLNVMTRRGRFRHGVKRVECEGVSTVFAGACEMLLFFDGAFDVTVENERYAADRHDVLVGLDARHRVTIACQKPTNLYVISLFAD